MNKDFTRRDAVKAAATSLGSLATVGSHDSETRVPLAVARGTTDDLATGLTGYSIVLLVLDSELKPAKDAVLELTLIGEDGGDGGFLAVSTDRFGIAEVDSSLWPGRYHVHVRRPKCSNLSDAEFVKPNSMLVVREDGTYSPREFRIS